MDVSAINEEWKDIFLFNSTDLLSTPSSVQPGSTSTKERMLICLEIKIFHEVSAGIEYLGGLNPKPVALCRWDFKRHWLNLSMAPFHSLNGNILINLSDLKYTTAKDFFPLPAKKIKHIFNLNSNFISLSALSCDPFVYGFFRWLSASWVL